MAAGTYTPTQAGEGPSMLSIAKSIGTKIRDAAEQAKEEREKADKEGVQVEKGSLFKSSLKNQFNPVKSKKAKSNWSKQFSWNQKKTDSPIASAAAAESQAKSTPEKLKNFIAGGFSAIMQDTTMMVQKLSSLNSLTSENVASASRASDTLTVIKETLSTQTELKRKSIEDAKYARTEKNIDKTQDVADVIKKKKSSSSKSDSSGDGGGEEGGGGMFDWLWKSLEIIDVLDDINDLRKGRNPFSRFRMPGTMPGTGPRVTTSGGAPAPAAKQPWWKKMLPFADDAAKGGTKAGAKGAGGLLGRLLPGAQTALGIGLAAKSFSEGDAVGGALNLGSALPGPFGWAFLAASLGRDIFAPGLGNKELGQAFSTPGLTPEQTSGMSGLERGMLDISTPSFTGFSEGGIVPSAVPPSPVSSMASGGIVDNPTKTILNPGDAVLPLDSNPAKNIFGKQKSADSEEAMAIPFKGAAAAFLGITSRMLGKTDSGIAGQIVAQDISRLSRQFGFTNVLTSTSLGKASYTKSDTEKESRNFLKDLFSGLNLFGEDEEDKGNGGSPSPTGATVSGGSAPGEGQFTMTSGFGSRPSPGGVGSTNHLGIDYNAPQGTPIAVLKPGKVAKVEPVIDAKTMSSVRIIHDDNTETRYAHLSRIDVQEGQQVGANQLIGLSGGDPNTPGAGPSTGPHVHFEYYAGPSAGPSDGSGVAKQYFTLGGTVVGAPAAQPMSNAKGGNVAVLSLGTNDWGVDSSIPQRNTQRIVKFVKDRGYNPVVIPPFNEGKFKKPRQGVEKGARLAGAPIVNMSGKPVDQYGHNSKKDRQRLGRMFKGALLIGDSNAQGIKYYTPKSRLIGGVGKDTDSIWADVRNSGLKPLVKPSSPASSPAASSPSSGQSTSQAPQRPAATSRPSSSTATRARSQQPQTTTVVNSGASGGGANTFVVSAPERTPNATAVTPFGASVPAGPTTAYTFADFLYPDLV